MLFLILTVLFFNLILIIIPKRLSHNEMVTTTLFAMILQVMTDIFLNLKYHLYGYFNVGVDWETMIYIIGIFPAVNILFLNYFPYKKQLLNKFVYIIGWTVFAVVFEILFLWSGTFYYHGWKLWYSAVLYPEIYLILVFFHKYTCYLINCDSSKNSRR